MTSAKHSRLFLSLTAFAYILLFAVVPLTQAKTSEELFTEAMALEKDGFLEDAATVWTQLMESNPDPKLGAIARLKLSSASFKLTQFQKSIDLAQELVNEQPDLFDAQFHLANSLSGIRKFPKAINVYKETVRIRPGEGLGYVGLAIVQFADRDTPSAVETLQAAKKIFKKKKNISWYRNCRIMVEQMKHFGHFPPNFSDLWVTNNLKLVRDTYEKSLFDVKELRK